MNNNEIIRLIMIIIAVMCGIFILIIYLLINPSTIGSNQQYTYILPNGVMCHAKQYADYYECDDGYIHYNVVGVIREVQ